MSVDNYLRGLAMAKAQVHSGARAVPKQRHGKIVRWIKGLSDTQVVDLAVRVSRAAAENDDVAGRVRVALLAFVQQGGPTPR